MTRSSSNKTLILYKNIICIFAAAKSKDMNASLSDATRTKRSKLRFKMFQWIAVFTALCVAAYYGRDVELGPIKVKTPPTTSDTAKVINDNRKTYDDHSVIIDKNYAPITIY